VDAQVEEFYRWLLGLTPDARMIRYGCDRYFNKLEKQPRMLEPKVRKKRPYPYWLSLICLGMVLAGKMTIQILRFLFPKRIVLVAERIYNRP
jgi:hypothetical protein